MSGDRVFSVTEELMKIGVDYYPENWDSKLWHRDAEIMAKSGVQLVRIGGLG